MSDLNPSRCASQRDATTMTPAPTNPDAEQISRLLPEQVREIVREVLLLTVHMGLRNVTQTFCELCSYTNRLPPCLCQSHNNRTL